MFPLHNTSLEHIFVIDLFVCLLVYDQCCWIMCAMISHGSAMGYKLPKEFWIYDVLYVLDIRRTFIVTQLFVIKTKQKDCLVCVCVCVCVCVVRESVRVVRERVSVCVCVVRERVCVCVVRERVCVVLLTAFIQCYTPLSSKLPGLLSHLIFNERL